MHLRTPIRHPLLARPGEQNGGAILDAAEVVAIRRRAADGASQRSLAQEYGVSDAQISRIVIGSSWRDADGPVRAPRTRAECMAIALQAERHPRPRRCPAVTEAQAVLVARIVENGFSVLDAHRFAALVETGGECWVWQGPPDRTGYGRIKDILRTPLAHRVSYAMLKGAIPNGLDVLHTCDVRLCVAPHHLYLGTDVENSRDRVQRERQSRGEGHSRAKLTEEQVVAVRRRAAAGETQVSIARAFGVESSTVGQIVLGIAWRHVGGPRVARLTQQERIARVNATRRRRSNGDPQ